MTGVKLEGKVAIITGASRGIGKEIAKLFAAQGAKVVCAARTLHEGDSILEGSLNTTVSEIQKAGGIALAIQTDLTKEDDCARLIETTKQQFGPADILVNDPAVNYLIPTKDLSMKRCMLMFAVNIIAPIILTKLVLPDMIEHRGGSIINISSPGAIGPGRGPYKPRERIEPPVYSATKAALERFSQGLAEEVYPCGISVTCVAPSNLVATPGAARIKLAPSSEHPRYEPMEMMAKAVLLVATAPTDKVTGRVVYSQAILKEFGWIDKGEGYGIDKPGSGLSQL